MKASIRSDAVKLPVSIFWIYVPAVCVGVHNEWAPGLWYPTLHCASTVCLMSDINRTRNEHYGQKRRFPTPLCAVVLYVQLYIHIIWA